MINSSTASILDTAIFSLVAEFAESIGLASGTMTHTQLTPDLDEETITESYATEADITLAARQPVSMASVLSDLAARLGIDLPPAIAAALDEPVSVVMEDASASSPTFQA